MKSRSGKGFDRISGIYDGLARMVFGRRIQKAQQVWAEKIPSGSKILIVGGGTGHCLQALMNNQVAYDIDYVDLSAGMLDKAQARINNPKATLHPHLNIQFIQGDFLQPGILPAESQYDFICAHFFLDLFTPDQLQEVLDKFAGLLTPAGKIWVADFRKPEAGKGRWLAKVLFPVMYSFFRLICRIPGSQLQDFESALAQKAYARIHIRYDFHGLILSGIWAQKQATQV